MKTISCPPAAKSYEITFPTWCTKAHQLATPELSHGGPVRGGEDPACDLVGVVIVKDPEPAADQERPEQLRLLPVGHPGHELVDGRIDTVIAVLVQLLHHQGALVRPHGWPAAQSRSHRHCSDRILRLHRSPRRCQLFSRQHLICGRACASGGATCPGVPRSDTKCRARAHRGRGRGP
jgi:hypothetical protein